MRVQWSEILVPEFPKCLMDPNSLELFNYYLLLRIIAQMAICYTTK